MTKKADGCPDFNDFMTTRRAALATKPLSRLVYLTLREGRAARAAGKPVSANPHSEEHPFYDVWAQGWLDAGELNDACL
jgi:hypothetical protein